MPRDTLLKGHAIGVKSLKGDQAWGSFDPGSPVLKGALPLKGAWAQAGPA
jgi:hypothetical protein